MKKVLIDATSLSDQYKDRGIGVYARYVTSGCITSNKFEWHLIGFDDLKDQLPQGNYTVHSLGKVYPSTPRNTIHFQTQFLPVINKIKPDLYFAPHFERGLPIGRCKTIVYMHDVIPSKTRKFSSKGILINYLKGLFHKYNLNKAKRADAILTNSNFSRKELMSLGFTSSKVHVIYPGIREEFLSDGWKDDKLKSEVSQKYHLETPYIYYVGGLEANKNVDNLIKAFARIKHKLSEIRLVLTDKNLLSEGNQIIAKDPNAMRIKDLINTYSLARDIIFTGFVEREEQPVITGNASVLVHLSSYEGFGSVVAEALAIGCPVVAANRSCYPEITDNAALLIDPDDIGEVTTSIIRVLQDQKLREELIAKGKRRSKMYRWNTHIKRTLEIFEENTK